MSTALVEEPAGRLAALDAARIDRTAIAWTDFTHNWWWGCSKVSTECRLCYADGVARFRGFEVWGNQVGRRILSDSNAAKPLRLERIAAAHDTFFRVFCGSMMDFAEQHPDPGVRATQDTARAAGCATIEVTPHLIWQMLTKRIDLVEEVIPEHWQADGWPENVWLGTSVGCQRSVDTNVPVLADMQGPRVKFLSVEPMVGPVDLGFWLGLNAAGEPDDYSAIDWVIVGGESGPLNAVKKADRARRMNPEWTRAVVEQCQTAGVPVFIKQTGSVLANEWGLAHRKGEDPAEWPEWMRVQQFPQAAA